MKIKCAMAWEAEEPWDCSSLDTTFNGIVVNEAWEFRYFSPFNQHQVKQKSQFCNWKRSHIFFKACIHLAPYHSVLGRTVHVRKNFSRGLWEPWAESGLQGPGGPLVLLWKIMWERVELGISHSWFGIRNHEVWELEVKMSMSFRRT